MRILINGIATTCCIIVILVATAAAGAGAGAGLSAQQMLAETNLARTEPARYADHLRKMRSNFTGNIYRDPGTAVMLVTTEGITALDEAISYLSRQAPLPPLAWSEGLAEAAADLVRDQGRSGKIGHDGGRSGGMQKRIEIHGTWMGRIAENIGYGPSTARLMVVELIVDDGVPDRGHRKNIFTRDFKVAGAACGPHPLYRSMCVMEFASQYKGRTKR
jgi:uncharacterized protein YkwD